MKAASRGFTLIELLVVIAIIAVLAAILFPVFTAVKVRAKQTQCMFNMQQVSTAFKVYMGNYNGRFPPTSNWQYGKPEHFLGGTFVSVLQPYAKNRAVFLCPIVPKDNYGDFDVINLASPRAPDQGWAVGTIRSAYGNNLALTGVKCLPNNTWQYCSVATESQVRYSSRTIYLCEARWVDVWGGWQAGRIGNAAYRHNGGATVLMCDGHAVWVKGNKLLLLPFKEDESSTIRWSP